MVPEIVIKLVEFYKGKLTQKKVLETLGVSRTTYNRWIKKTPINKEETELVELVRSLCIENKYRYGYRKITYLVNQKIKANKNTVQKIMQKYGLNCKVRPKRRKSTGQPYKIVENIMNINLNTMHSQEKNIYRNNLFIFRKINVVSPKYYRFLSSIDY